MQVPKDLLGDWGAVPPRQDERKASEEAGEGRDARGRPGVEGAGGHLVDERADHEEVGEDGGCEEQGSHARPAESAVASVAEGVAAATELAALEALVCRLDHALDHKGAEEGDGKAHYHHAHRRQEEHGVLMQLRGRRAAIGEEHPSLLVGLDRVSTPRDVGRDAGDKDGGAHAYASHEGCAPLLRVRGHDLIDLVHAARHSDTLRHASFPLPRDQRTVILRQSSERLALRPHHKRRLR
mmetsp:Transcript_47302/g.73926  ORF Transcript_47302/g.73926 Transcript_47302/m.73926 type:complete len:239 (-) Transcript_47302:11-727(-)